MWPFRMDGPSLVFLFPFADLETYNKSMEVKGAFVFCLMKCHRVNKAIHNLVLPHIYGESGQEPDTVTVGVTTPLGSAHLQSSTLQKASSFASVSAQWIF